MQGTTDKIPIQALVCRETGEVRSRVVPDVTGENLRHALATHTDPGLTLRVYAQVMRQAPPEREALRDLVEGKRVAPPVARWGSVSRS